MDSPLEKLPNTKYKRRLLFFIIGIVCLVLCVLRFLVVPYLFGTPFPGAREMIDSVLGDMLTTAIASIGIGLLIFWLTPPVMEAAVMEVVPPHQRSEVLTAARTKTQEWWLSGGIGRFTRAVTLPALAAEARATNFSKKIVLLILDPTSESACDYYKTYRQRSRTGGQGQPWTVERVRNELYATIVSAYAWRAQEPLLDIAVGLKQTTSLFRIDLSSHLVIITKEDPQEPALRCDASTFFYNSYLEDLKLSLSQSRVLPNDVNGVPFAKFDKGNLTELLTRLGIHNKALTDTDMQAIIDYALKRENPYG